MNIIKTELKDCLLIEPDIYGDERGFFMETFQLSKYKNQANISYEFVQDNLSYSQRNILRGLHFQKKNPQGKLVRVVKGEVYDVVVDLRSSSPTFSKWIGVYLSEKNKKQMWVPPDFAHGFLVTSSDAIFEYKCTNYYDPSDEYTLLWNDPSLNIDWPSANPILSNKDINGLTLNSLFK